MGFWLVRFLVTADCLCCLVWLGWCVLGFGWVWCFLGCGLGFLFLCFFVEWVFWVVGCVGWFCCLFGFGLLFVWFGLLVVCDSLLGLLLVGLVWL